MIPMCVRMKAIQGSINIKIIHSTEFYINYGSKSPKHCALCTFDRKVNLFDQSATDLKAILILRNLQSTPNYVPRYTQNNPKAI